MTEPKRDTTPWRVARNDGALGPAYCILDATDLPVATELTKTEAERIVRAVNGEWALREALRKCVRAISDELEANEYDDQTAETIDEWRSLNPLLVSHAEAREAARAALAASEE